MSAVARGCIFFYGHKGDHACFSQFFPSAFVDENGVEYCCAEQFMMASKARCMGDAETLEAIMACDYDPVCIKALGRRVSVGWHRAGLCLFDVWREPARDADGAAAPLLCSSRPHATRTANALR